MRDQCGRWLGLTLGRDDCRFEDFAYSSFVRFGNILASCSYDRRVIIWQEGGGQWTKIYEYTNHDSSVNSVQWAPHDFGLILVCGSSDGAISVLTYSANN